MPAFLCVTVGVLCAAVLAAVRISWHGLALVFIVVFGLGRYGLTQQRGLAVRVERFPARRRDLPRRLVFDLLGRRGLVMGKFLIMGRCSAACSSP